MRRRFGALPTATLTATLLAALLLPVAALPVAAATPDLTLVTDARYDVQPAQHRVHVTVDITATNRRRDTTTRRYYYESAFLAVPPGTTGFRIASAGSKPSVRVTAKQKTHTLLRIDFGRRLNGGKSMELRLQFDLPDPGGAPTRQIRVGDSLVSFPVWAFASDSTPGSTVSVTFPAGYEIRLEAGSMPAPTGGSDGSVVYRTGRLVRPLDFYAFFVAERPGSLAEGTVQVRIGGSALPLTIRSWPDDPAWAKRVGDLFGRGLPILAERVGVPYSGPQPLVVQEAVSRSTGGYAGLFDPAEGRIEVAYYADPGVILHEAAHAWFNGRLLADRWLNEGFASWYAGEAARQLKVKVAAPTLTKALEAARIPLNDWPGSGSEDRLTDDYGYAASLKVAGLIAERAGEDGLRAVWADAAAGRSAYEGAGGSAATPPDPGAAGGAAGAPDWRGVLDLLEARTGKRFDDLWRTWVVRPDEAKLLDDRAAARADYEAALELAGDWQLPVAIHEAMAAWHFDQARALLRDARAALGLRDQVRVRAAAAGLTAPGTLRTAFEADSGLAAAIAEGEAELATIGAIEATAAARNAPQRSEPLDQLGLLWQDPDAEMAAARAAFTGGDLAKAVDHADAARSVWLDAGEIGRTRATTILAAALAAFAVIVLVGSWVRRRRAVPPSVPPAPDEVPTSP